MNGLAFGGLVFLLAAGLSIIFGLMDVLNLAHGSFYMIGAYTAYSVVLATHSFWLALLIAPLLLALVGGLLELVFFRRLYRHGHLAQVLLTFGFTLVFVDLIRSGYGPTTRSIAPPPSLGGAVHFLGATFSSYSLFVLGVAVVVGALLLAAWRRLRVGAVLRAGVADKEMAGLLGIDLARVFTLTFAFGAGLAGLAGVIAAPEFAIFPAMDASVLILALVVVVLGGLGSIEGAIVGAAVIGLGYVIGTTLFPQVALVLIFGLMAAVLVVRPTGLFGRR
ncbi:branched-chain amino acid ABC transporter permease [Candidatus Dormiibacter inghamiae]|uniref:branched-chain amino acid ABC transporter permease n=1 Tax=Candidatus Dormiibacter inghamiae TaxID=3127013 RepID=UPI0030C729F6